MAVTFSFSCPCSVPISVPSKLSSEAKMMLK